MMNNECARKGAIMARFIVHFSSRLTALAAMAVLAAASAFAGDALPKRG
jgi:hypothetical protein